MKTIFFGRRIEPACSYCELGRPTRDGQMILCKKNGVVAPCFSCRRFVYAPLKRRPSRIQTLPEFSKEDFEL
ncbi:MAG TPA: hypothetical protein IAB55_09160 [Candidatus Merdivicinus faecavium]|nr:hypothetical protein [Candidatus Merdivicinus faecavium]